MKKDTPEEIEAKLNDLLEEAAKIRRRPLVLALGKALRQADPEAFDAMLRSTRDGTLERGSNEAKPVPRRKKPSTR